MSNDRLILAVRIAILLSAASVLGASCYVLHERVWSHDFVVWASNAHAMAESGIWSGPQAMKAQLAHLFIAFYGRTALSAVLGAIWLVCIYMLGKWTFAGRPGRPAAP